MSEFVSAELPCVELGTAQSPETSFPLDLDWQNDLPDDIHRIILEYLRDTTVWSSTVFPVTFNDYCVANGASKYEHLRSLVGLACDFSVPRMIQLGLNGWRFSRVTLQQEEDFLACDKHPSDASVIFSAAEKVSVCVFSLVSQPEPLYGAVEKWAKLDRSPLVFSNAQTVSLFAGDHGMVPNEIPIEMLRHFRFPRASCLNLMLVLQTASDRTFDIIDTTFPLVEDVRGAFANVISKTMAERLRVFGVDSNHEVIKKCGHVLPKTLLLNASARDNRDEIKIAAAKFPAVKALKLQGSFQQVFEIDGEFPNLEQLHVERMFFTSPSLANLFKSPRLAELMLAHVRHSADVKAEDEADIIPYIKSPSIRRLCINKYYDDEIVLRPVDFPNLEEVIIDSCMLKICGGFQHLRRITFAWSHDNVRYAFYQNFVEFARSSHLLEQLICFVLVPHCIVQAPDMVFSNLVVLSIKMNDDVEKPITSDSALDGSAFPVLKYLVIKSVKAGQLTGIFPRLEIIHYDGLYYNTRARQESLELVKAQSNLSKVVFLPHDGAVNVYRLDHYPLS